MRVTEVAGVMGTTEGVGFNLSIKDEDKSPQALDERLQGPNHCWELLRPRKIGLSLEHFDLQLQQPGNCPTHHQAILVHPVCELRELAELFVDRHAGNCPACHFRDPNCNRTL